VAGRAGRADKAGEIILQTYAPRHYVYNMAQHYDYTAFYKKEANMREVTKFPPFATIYRILISGTSEEDVRNHTKTLYEAMQEVQKQHASAFIYLGVMKSPIGRIQNKFRYQILMRTKKENDEEIRQNIFKIIETHKNKDVLAFVEINPQNLS